MRARRVVTALVGFGPAARLGRLDDAPLPGRDRPGPGARAGLLHRARRAGALRARARLDALRSSSGRAARAAAWLRKYWDASVCWGSPPSCWPGRLRSWSDPGCAGRRRGCEGTGTRTRGSRRRTASSPEAASEVPDVQVRVTDLGPGVAGRVDDHPVGHDGRERAWDVGPEGGQPLVRGRERQVQPLERRDRSPHPPRRAGGRARPPRRSNGSRTGTSSAIPRRSWGSGAAAVAPDPGPGPPAAPSPAGRRGAEAPRRPPPGCPGSTRRSQPATGRCRSATTPRGRPFDLPRRGRSRGRTDPRPEASRRGSRRGWPGGWAARRPGAGRRDETRYA